MKKGLLILILFASSCDKYNPAIQYTLTIDGNSIAAGALSTNGGYGPYLHKLFPNDIYNDIGISGQQTIQMIQRQYADTVLLHTGLNLLIVEEGSNDINDGASGDSAYKDYKTYCTDRKAKFPNTKIILISPTPRWGRTGFEADRQRLLSLLNNDFRIATGFANIYRSTNNYADVLVDVGNDKIIGFSGAENDTIYYNTDRVHPTDSGYIYRGKFIANGIRSIAY
jgi:lysophospholipase L1-like esterase